MKNFLLFLSLSLGMNWAMAADTLTINGAEFGIGKFHRYDNKVHKYDQNNTWNVFILPDGVKTKQAYVQKNAEDNYTIFFTNLEEFLTKIVELSVKTGKKVGMLNLNAHGLPGGMWFPKNVATRDSEECVQWRQAASDSDGDNYSQYYSSVSKEDMLYYNDMAETSRIPSYQCLTGLREWAAIAKVVPAIKTVFSDDAQVHMLSCIVGLGSLGDNYTQGIAKLLFPNLVNQQVQTSIKFGLGDWSMPEGMGFWGFESDAQLARDNEIYPVNRKDSEIMQRGNIRVADVVNGKIVSGLMTNEFYIYLTRDDRPVYYPPTPTKRLKISERPLPVTIRIPGTNFFTNLN